MRACGHPYTIIALNDRSHGSTKHASRGVLFCSVLTCNSMWDMHPTPSSLAGMIHNSRLALSGVGTQADVTVLQQCKPIPTTQPHNHKAMHALSIDPSAPIHPPPPPTHNHTPARTPDREIDRKGDSRCNSSLAVEQTRFDAFCSPVDLKHDNSEDVVGGCSGLATARFVVYLFIQFVEPEDPSPSLIQHQPVCPTSMHIPAGSHSTAACVRRASQ